VDLYPHNLGEWINQEVQQERSQASLEPGEGVKPNSFGGWALGCLIVAGLFWAMNGPAMAVFLAVCAVFCFACYGFLALRALNAEGRHPRPVSAYELQSIRQRAQDLLVQSYLDLAQSVVQLPATKDATADREVREAITALGTAVKALPPEMKIVTDDPAALRAEAEMQVIRAQAEGDAVIAASLRRRTESLLRRSDTAARTLLLLRRNRALREEVGEQIRALQTSLTALQVGGRQSVPELSDLAASIHRVALEANAVTVARAEVDTLLSRPAVTGVVPMPAEGTREQPLHQNAGKGMT